MSKKFIVGILVVVFLLTTLAIAIAVGGDTIWHLENDYGVCSASDCHPEIKKGHMDQKKKCDPCHEPGEKKEVHSVAVVLWDVANPDEWYEFCSQCHPDVKKGHQDKKKECLKCHGPGEKKDVHVEMPNEDCGTCHGEPDAGPTVHLENCDTCHQYMPIQ